MNFKKMIASVSDSVKSIDFDFVAAGKTIVDTAKTAGDVLAEKGKEIKTHYEDVKAERASRPKEVKVERLDPKD